MALLDEHDFQMEGYLSDPSETNPYLYGTSAYYAWEKGKECQLVESSTTLESKKVLT